MYNMSARALKVMSLGIYGKLVFSEKQRVRVHFTDVYSWFVFAGIEAKVRSFERPFARPPPMPSKNSGGKVNGHGQWAGRRGYRCPAKCPSPSSVSFC
jgi:hypothetical protein